MKNTTEKGITLISLIVTIIVLIIIASISIGIINNDSVVDRTKTGVEVTTVTEEENIIRLAYTDLETNEGTNNKKLTKEYFEAVLKEYASNTTVTLINEEDIKENEKIIESTEGATQYVRVEFQDTKNTYIVGLKTGDEDLPENRYLITYDANGGEGAPLSQFKTKGQSIKIREKVPTRTGFECIGWGLTSDAKEVAYKANDLYEKNQSITLYAIWKDAVAPVITELTATTNSITIKAKDNETEIVEYAISTSDTVPTEFISIESSNEITMTVTDLIQTTTYYIWVKDTGGNLSEVKSIETKTVPALEIGNNITFIPSPSEWTKGNVTVSATTTETGYTLQTSADGENWETINPITYSTNGTMYARLSDGKNVGKYASYNITNIDKLAPNTFTPSTTVTTKSIKIEASATDQSETTEYGCSGIAGYRFSKDNGSSYTSWQTSGTYTFDSLTQTTTYNLKVQVKDNAGNVTTVSLSAKTKTVPALVKGTNVTFTASPTGWTNGNVTVTASTTETGFTLQTSTDASSWKTTNPRTYSANGTMYARLSDGTNAGSYASYSVTNIDKVVPTISLTATASSTIATEGSLSATVQDTNSGLSKIVWYYKTSSASSYSSTTTTYTTMNGTTTGTTSSVTKTKSLTGLSPSTTYNIYAIVYDVAGNKKQSSTVNMITGAAIAQYNSVKYTSIQNAITAVSSTGTVTILANTDNNGRVQAKNITIDLNGKTINGNFKVGADSTGGTLTMKGTGTVTSSGYCIEIDSGTLNIQNGTYKGTGTGTTPTIKIESGTANISGGTITCAGTIGVRVHSNATVKISGGSITGANYGVAVYSSSYVNNVITITGGTITGNGGSSNGAGVYLGGSKKSLTISGGTVKSPSGYGILITGSSYTVTYTKANVSGGAGKCKNNGSGNSVTAK